MTIIYNKLIGFDSSSVDSTCAILIQRMSENAGPRRFDRPGRRHRPSGHAGSDRRPPISPRDADLYDAGLTSMAMVKLMLAVEVAFDIAIPDADLHPDNFRSVAAVEALVARLRRA